MFGFSVLLAVLALAGAPASTPVVCNPALTVGEYGLTWQYANGTPGIVNGATIELGPLACGALVYAAASPQERRKIRALNPGVDFDRMLGIGLQVALHEANHVALRSKNECLVEKTARTEINGLIERYADPKRALFAETDATVSDAFLPAAYHGC